MQATPDAPALPDIARLWEQMRDNRRSGARRAATTLLAEPGVPPRIGQRYAEEVFWIAIDPGTYRNLTLGRGLHGCRRCEVQAEAWRAWKQSAG
jgi:hypothetical protein